jgi:hypothetical protein
MPIPSDLDQTVANYNGEKSKISSGLNVPLIFVSILTTSKKTQK